MTRSDTPADGADAADGPQVAPMDAAPELFVDGGGRGDAG